jgi:hypothetical protein
MAWRAKKRWMVTAAEGEALLRQAGANLLDSGVPAVPKRCHHRFMMGLVSI